MATRAVRSGHSVCAYDIATERAAALAPDGVRCAEAIANAVAGAEVVVIMVATPTRWSRSCLCRAGVAGTLSAGAIVMIMATVGPGVVNSAARRLAPGGIAVVDARFQEAHCGQLPANC